MKTKKFSDIKRKVSMYQKILYYTKVPNFIHNHFSNLMIYHFMLEYTTYILKLIKQY